jgi:hypothetical protein
VAALVRYVKRDVPTELALTDPALYQSLRSGVTHFYRHEGGALNLARLEELAAGHV